MICILYVYNYLYLYYIIYLYTLYLKYNIMYIICNEKINVMGWEGDGGGLERFYWEICVLNRRRVRESKERKRGGIVIDVFLEIE